VADPAAEATRGEGVARILVVDDDRAVLQTIEAMLDLADHDVATAGDIDEALRKLSAGAFDLVLTDLDLGSSRGTEVIAKVRERLPDLPVLAMSGNPAKDNMAAIALRLGARDVLQKPFTRRVLERAVLEALQAPGRAKGHGTSQC
jgi:two-component system, NtrC family, response regulator HydG